MQVVVFPEPSVIVHTTEVAPRVKTCPANVFVPLTLFVTDATEQLSAVAVGSNSLATVV